MGLAGSNTRLDERNHTFHPINLEIPHCVGHTPLVQPFLKTSPAWVPNHWWWRMGVRIRTPTHTRYWDTIYFVAWWKRWKCLILKDDRSTGSNITVLRATEQPCTVRCSGWRREIRRLSNHCFLAKSCPAEVGLSEQSQNAGELQSLVSLNYKYHFYFFKYF